MSRDKKPPHLIKKKGRPLKDGTVRIWWVIKDGEYQQRTGCIESEVEGAERALKDYLGKKHQPVRENAESSEIPIADTLSIYLDYKLPFFKKDEDKKDFKSRISRLNDFWGNMYVSEILGDTCREFIRNRGKQAAARKDLAYLRASVNHYKKEYGMTATPSFTLPQKSQPRERWLTRSEAARLLWTSYREGKIKKRKHLVRFIIIALYTGTRHKAILQLQWMPNTMGGWIDLENGVLYRRSEGTEETKKRRPPVRIPKRLLAHLKRWKNQDSIIRHVVHFEGREISRLEKSFRNARKDACLDNAVVPHVLRHTAITWLMQAGVPLIEVSGFTGVSMKELERTYLHHHPDYQTSIVNVRLSGKRT